MGRPAVKVALAAGLAMLTTTLASPTAAQPAGDVAYEGTQEAGGPVRLMVSGDGTRIVLFEAEGMAGGGCSWDTITLMNWGGEVAVADNRFAATNPDGDTLSGAWVGDAPAERRIEGTIQVRDPVKGCETPPLRWVVVASPP